MTEEELAMSWETICNYHDIPDNTGAAALVDDRQIALFKVGGQLYAIDNYDPIGRANVLARGIIGSMGDELCVASPLYKQHFSLLTGKCVEQEVSVKCYAVRVVDGVIELDKRSLGLQAA